jgi:hypothetical protein
MSVTHSRSDYVGYRITFPPLSGRFEKLAFAFSVFQVAPHQAAILLGKSAAM